MAIDTVIINQNTSIIPDEVLSHRLGLISILADAKEFEYKKENDEFKEKNSIKFELKVKCYKDNNNNKNNNNSNKNNNNKNEIINNEIFSSELKFVNQGKQMKNLLEKIKLDLCIMIYY